MDSEWLLSLDAVFYLFSLVLQDTLKLLFFTYLDDFIIANVVSKHQRTQKHLKSMHCLNNVPGFLASIYLAE